MNARVVNAMGDLYPITDGGQELTVAAVAVGLGGLPENTEKVMLMTDTANIRARLDGTDPTTSTGFQLTPNTTWVMSAAEARAVKFIREGATSGHIHAQAYQE